MTDAEIRIRFRLYFKVRIEKSSMNDDRSRTPKNNIMATEASTNKGKSSEFQFRIEQMQIYQSQNVRLQIPSLIRVFSHANRKPQTQEQRATRSSRMWREDHE